MKKNLISIPTGITYIGDDVMQKKMPGFRFETGIYNKVLTGCGATTFALKEDEMNVVLLVPRITLLKNKAEQTEDCQMVYEEISNQEIKEYLDSHQGRRKVFISTYDSAGRLRRLLGDSWKGYHVYVDEFHVILSDASFKSYTEMALIETVKDAEWQTWLSATPCLDEFIGRIPHLKDLPYYELDWQEKERIEIQNISVKNPINALGQVVRMYLNGVFPTLTDDDGKLVDSSKTMNGFFSSVNGILSIVKQYGLTPENTDIICSSNEANVDALRELGFKIGSIPLKGEPRKMFTLCTSTAYQGMDFYGEDTTTFVIADCKKQNTAVDIQTELVQICGRERLKKNPFRKTVVFIHNDWNGEADLQERYHKIREKRTVSQELMELFNREDLSEATHDCLVKMMKQQKKAAGDQLCYTFWDEEKGSFELNELSEISDEYEARVQFSIYHDGAFVLQNIGEQNVLSVKDKGSWLVSEQVKNIVLKTTFTEQMKEYCRLRQQTFAENSIKDILIYQLERQNEALRGYYDALGPERIKALNYRESGLQNEMKLKLGYAQLRVELDKVVHLGDEHTREEWKAILQGVYDKLDIKKKAVAKHLGSKYGYKMIEHHRTDKNGKRYYSYEIAL